ncbi:MAG: basic secretory family protein [Actinobacteria bacterium]|nr:basic secretory family protein [Actinomycetota bacterium]
MPRRPRWWLVGLCALIIVSAGLVAWSVVSTDDDQTFDVDVPATDTGAVDPAGAALALQEFVRAIETDDGPRAAAVAGADPSSQSLAVAVVDNASAAHIRDVSLRYIDSLGTTDSAGVWDAAVAVEWRYAGFDVAPASTETVVRFESGEEGVRVVDLGGESLRSPLWLTSALSVSRTEETLVLSAASELLDQYTRLSRRAVDTVARVLPEWDRRLVVEVPADRVALEEALDVESGNYQQIAAVAGSADGTVTADSAVHVYVNPAVFGGLGKRGREVVLAHEAAHVAGDGPTSRAPTWLVEGFADYVALRDSPLPVTRTAAQIRERVRSEGLPTALPSASDFDVQGPHLGSVYEAAWLACRVLAEHRDDSSFLNFYDAVSGGEALGSALRRIFDWSLDEFVVTWQNDLSSLLG